MPRLPSQLWPADERAVADEFPPLVGVLGEQLARPADQPGCRLVARTGEHLDVEEDFAAREAPGRARLVLELGHEELGHQVVRRVLRPPVDVRREDLGAAREGVVVQRGRPPVLNVDAPVGLIAYRLLVLFGDAEEHADRPHGHLRSEIGDEIEAA